jgi:hypothetical protein
MLSLVIEARPLGFGIPTCERVTTVVSAAMGVVDAAVVVGATVVVGTAVVVGATVVVGTAVVVGATVVVGTAVVANVVGALVVVAGLEQPVMIKTLTKRMDNRITNFFILCSLYIHATNSMKLYINIIELTIGFTHAAA